MACIPDGKGPYGPHGKGVDCLETVTRRGSSQKISIRVAMGVYHRSRAFQSRAVEWEETVHGRSAAP